MVTIRKISSSSRRRSETTWRDSYFITTTVVVAREVALEQSGSRSEALALASNPSDDESKAHEEVQRHPATNTCQRAGNDLARQDRPSPAGPIPIKLDSRYMQLGLELGTRYT